MSTTDYNSATDGDLIVKASALEAAFARYHQKYQQDRATVMDYKGSVATMAALYALLNDSTVTLSVGDVYNVTETGENFAYRDPGAGTHQPADYWDNLGSIVDLTGYATEDYVDDKFENDLTIDGDLTVTGGIEASGEVTAKETVVEDGVSTVVNHNLTDKLDASDYRAAYTWADAAGKFTWASIKGDTSTTGDTNTPNLNLVKPGLGTSVDVTDLNSNFNKIDAAAKLRVANGAGNAVGVNQLTFLDNANSLWKNLDEVRIYNNTDVLYCKEGVTTGLLMQDNQLKIVPVTWNNGIPAVGTMKAYIDSNGDYHIYDSTTASNNTSIATLRDSVSSNNTDISNINSRLTTNFVKTNANANGYLYRSGSSEHAWYIGGTGNDNIDWTMHIGQNGLFIRNGTAGVNTFTIDNSILDSKMDTSNFVTASGTITHNNVKTGSVKYWRNYKTVMVFVYINALNSTPSASTSYQVGTLPSNAKPADDVFAPLFQLDTPVGNIYINSSSGGVLLRITGTPSASALYRGTATFVMT